MRKAIAKPPVVILCGGLGTRLSEETEVRPKPLVEIGGRPILWHIMKHYSTFGFNEFILCLGYKGQMIRDYFLNYEFHQHDLRIQLGKGQKQKVTVLSDGRKHEPWTITLADTGGLAMTGARLKRIEHYVQTKQFLMTYGDGVSNVDVSKLLQCHLNGDSIGTLTGVEPPGRFGELELEGVDRQFKNKTSNTGETVKVKIFAEKPKRSKTSATRFINGGFFVFDREFFQYLTDNDSCVLEQEPLQQLTRDGQLQMVPHDGFWQCMDTMRDLLLLRELWATGKAPWKLWQDDES